MFGESMEHPPCDGSSPKQEEKNKVSQKSSQGKNTHTQLKPYRRRHACWIRVYTTAQLPKVNGMHTKPSPTITNIKIPRKQVPHSVKGFVNGPLNMEGVLEQERVNPSPKHRFGSAHTLYATALGVLQLLGIKVQSRKGTL